MTTFTRKERRHARNLEKCIVRRLRKKLKPQNPFAGFKLRRFPIIEPQSVTNVREIEPLVDKDPDPVKFDLIIGKRIV